MSAAGPEQDAQPPTELCGGSEPPHSVDEEHWITHEHQQILFDVAEASIAHGLSSGGPLVVDPRTFPEDLRDRPRPIAFTVRMAISRLSG